MSIARGLEGLKNWCLEGRECSFWNSAGLQGRVLKGPVFLGESLRHPRHYFRCGEEGHIASLCRNGLLCFRSNKLGHRSSLYQMSNKGKTMVVDPSPPGSLVKSSCSDEVVEIPFDKNVAKEIWKLRNHGVAVLERGVFLDGDLPEA